MTTIRVFNSQTKEQLKEDDFLSDITPADFKEVVKEWLEEDSERTKLVRPDVAEISNNSDDRLDLEPIRISVVDMY